MGRKYFVNPLAVIFHPELDLKNGYVTLVSNPQTETVMKINKQGYFILKAIEENPAITFEALSTLLKSNSITLQKFLGNMVESSVLIEK